ncbi:hypothetical protein [Clostridium paridis]|uniref:Lipoprotein n=1 Tax=Clostridium paridis TaxID=2803863 RepID=A0A937K391_9CLOT|nr:hypothetical protein [Clostridium paridis]MBL4932171.1 hypothetical protein [Clostridium paridis]
MKKKIITILLVVVSAFSVACGNKKDEGAQVSKENNQSVSQTNNKENSSAEEAKSNTIDSSNNNKALNSVKNTSSQSTSNKQEEKFYGNWVAKKKLGFAKVSAFSNEDVDKIIGMKFSFSKESASCFRDSLDSMKDVAANPKYTKRILNEDDLWNDYRINLKLKDLGIENGTITEVQAQDASGKGCTFFIKDDNTLILNGGGVLIELNRA